VRCLERVDGSCGSREFSAVLTAPCNKCMPGWRALWPMDERNNVTSLLLLQWTLGAIGLVPEVKHMGIDALAVHPSPATVQSCVRPFLPTPPPRVRPRQGCRLHKARLFPASLKNSVALSKTTVHASTHHCKHQHIISHCLMPV
jgi:hypothetical protein